MARHLLRDYLTQNTTSPSRRYIPSYLMSMFLRRVLLYTYVGDTNFNINSVGPLLISTADSTPTAATPTFAGGTRAGINLGNGLEFNVSVPVGTRTVSIADVGRILVLRSTANPTYNSGCFLIDGYDVTSNSYHINYRTGTALNGQTVIAAGSNNVALPTGTINVATTTGFPTSGTILVTTTSGVQTVNYTGTNATQFTGCTGGVGVMNTNNPVVASVALPTGTLLTTSTTGFTSTGQIFVFSTTGRQTITYTGITATSFTGCTGGTGSILGGSPIVAGVTTTIAAGSNGQTLPQATINVAATNTASTTIAVGSNNVRLPTGTINVASTAGFTTTGIIYVTTSTGLQTVQYTGTTGTSFTGCTGGTGTMTTGGSVVAGFYQSGYFFINTSAGVQQVSYTGKTTTSFTGCTGGTGTMSTGGAVFFSPSLPPIEPTDSMNWYLYASDANCPLNGTENTNPAGQYRGNGNSTTPRLILQSPHPMGWQVRICNETGTDQSNSSAITFIPGFDGNASGDFLVTGRHLHTPLFYNSSSGIYVGGAPGCGDFSVAAGVVYRHTIVGEDDGYATGALMIGRRPSNGTNPKSFLVSFGLPENEPTPLPTNNEARLYAIGSATSGDNLNDTSWYPGNNGTSNLAQGVSVQENEGTTAALPVSSCVSLITYVSGVGQTGSPIFDGSAGDNPWIGGIELFPVDIITGTFSGWGGGTAFPILGTRFIGTMPHIREGRANFAEYTLTHDNARAFLHIRRGEYIFWGGPPLIV